MTITCASLMSLLVAGAAMAADPIEIETVDVEPVWSAHPVGFCLLTSAPHQFVAYYDAQRRMTVAQRRLDGKSWTFTRLPSTLGWDSHNYHHHDFGSRGFPARLRQHALRAAGVLPQRRSRWMRRRCSASPR